MHASWLKRRCAGVLLHPTSLPGPGGVGTLGAEARAFVDFLAEADCRLWQVCPLGPTGYADSPYAAFSAFAGNPYLIDLEPLVALGWLDRAALAPLAALPSDRTDYGGLWAHKWTALRAAHAGFIRAGSPATTPYGDPAAFRAQHAAWLTDFTRFVALKDKFGGRPWMDWPENVRTAAAAARQRLPAEVLATAEAHAFYQWLFFAQWGQLRRYAHDRRVELVGDLPLYVALDSADVWSNPSLFQFDPRTGRPAAVAGVPPDYFSADGQLWGNPLYDWDALRADGYGWWLRRLELNYSLCDILRLDHFRGFHDYWAVPAGASSARTGAWRPGPGEDFFAAVRARFPGAPLIAEDLGELSPGVVALREATGLPGMLILQFAWGGDGSNLYLPHHATPNAVVYPGTHDNSTTRGWYASAPEKARDHVRRYFRISGDDIAWDFIRAAYVSPARLAVVAAQDLLALGDEARFNTPGRTDGNWQWRLRPDAFAHLRRSTAPYLRELAALGGRDGPPATQPPETGRPA